ncbi:MAG: hypothetical protein ACLQGP_35610 [Isosphaeraceae bacterium]
MDIDHDRREDDLKALEDRLTAWRPASGSLDRDRMLYDSGRAAGRGEGPIRSWRMATAALLLLTISLGGLLVHQGSLLDRERALLAQERARRRATETAIAARPAAQEPSPPTPSPTLAATKFEPLSPTSYFVMTARMASDVRDVPSPDLEIEPGTRRSPTEPAVPLPQPDPLRARDIRQVLDL